MELQQAREQSGSAHTTATGVSKEQEYKKSEPSGEVQLVQAEKHKAEKGFCEIKKSQSSEIEEEPGTWAAGCEKEARENLFEAKTQNKMKEKDLLAQNKKNEQAVAQPDPEGTQGATEKGEEANYPEREFQKKSKAMTNLQNNMDQGEASRHQAKTSRAKTGEAHCKSGPLATQTQIRK